MQSPKRDFLEGKVFPDYFRPNSEGVVLLVLLQPKASKTEIVGPFGDRPTRLKIRVSSPPIEGAANDALVAFLSQLLRKPKSQIELRKGHSQKQKEILLVGLTGEAQIDQALALLASN